MSREFYRVSPASRGLISSFSPVIRSPLTLAGGVQGVGSGGGGVERVNQVVRIECHLAVSLCDKVIWVLFCAFFSLLLGLVSSVF